MLRNRETGTFKESENYSQMNEPRIEAKANNYSLDNKKQPKDEEWYREKILEFVSQLNGMPALEDFSEGKVRKISRKSDIGQAGKAADLNNPDKDTVHDKLRATVASSYKPFTEKTGLSSEAKEKFIDLLVYRKLDTMDASSGAGHYSSGNISKEDIQRELDEINEDYDKQISELLSDEEFAEYKEYEEEETRISDNRKKLIGNLINIAGNRSMSESEKKDVLEGLLNVAKGYLSESEIESFKIIISDDELKSEMSGDESDQENLDE